MGAFVLRRILASLPLLVGVTVLCFAVMHLAPGDPTTLMGDFDPRAHANTAMKAAYGLDQPIYVQYLHWVGNLLQGKLGVSLAPDGLKVWDKIAAAMPLTLWLNLGGLLLVLVLSVPIGVWVAAKPFGLRDGVVTLLLYVGLAAPSVWLALLGMQFFGVTLGWVPLSGLRSFGAESWGWWAQARDIAWHIALPVGVGIVGSLAGISRFVRGSMVEVLRQDYILTARAKGASEQRVLVRHALRNALLPVITILGLSLPGLIGGSVIMESIFALPGMGKLFYDAVLMRDYPVIMALLTLGSALTLVGNLLADMAYAWADPRVE
ncbi:MAG: ABC transporter permease subunit [Proteobacteria bacterium]|nr:ABC transporter permease subunit [Pseudomonadota bacterium]